MIIRTKMSINAFAFLILLLVIFPAQLGLNNPWQPFMHMGLITYVSLGAVLFLIGNRFHTRIPPVFFLFGLVFFSIAAISAILSRDIQVLLVYGSLMLLFFLTNLISSRILAIDELILKIVIGALSTGICLSLLSSIY